MNEWDKCCERFPWPEVRPTTQPLVHGWHTEERQWAVLLGRVPVNAVVLEVGAWTGKTSLHVLVTCPGMRLIAVDIWTESPVVLGNYWPKWRAEGHVKAGDTPKSLYQANVWDYRDRVVVIQGDSVAGMLAVAACGVSPALVYIDADHGEKAVYRDVMVALDCFPDALISGHDYTTNAGSDDSPVGRAVRRIGIEQNLRTEHIAKVWWYER